MKRQRWRRAARRSDGAAANALIRFVVGGVFVSEGIQKFLFPAELGVGRFAKIGIPWPHVLAPFVGVVEIVGGALVLVGLFTRAISMPLLVNMLVAITSTKIVTLGRTGFWKTAHEARTDLLMICCLLFLLVAGAGRLSVDRMIDERAKRTGP
jgi:putative oxidoreductase